MKFNNYFILCFFILVSCSKKNNDPLIITLLEKSAHEDERVIQRAVANHRGNKCLKDVFTVDVLKNEIKELEKKFAIGNKVQGTWKHLDLSTLPIPQANFLNRFGSRIGDLNNPDAFDYSKCKDVPCIFNQIYGKENHVAGYVHYLWYLKMGSYLAATNNVYDSESQTAPGIYNGKKFEVKDYLYRDSELFAFWRLLMMMKGPYTDLTNLSEIYRVPQNESFDFEVEKRVNGVKALSETCGIAYPIGYVNLQDFCLTLNSDWESGNFFQSVLHEITHQLDYHEGRKLKQSHRSISKDYLDVSYMELVREWIDERNYIKREWRKLNGIQLVTSYAGTNPSENFAETLSWFRVDGDYTKKSISSDHWSFVSKNYYSNNSFQKKDLVKKWIHEGSSHLSQMALKSVKDCFLESGNKPSDYFSNSQFEISLLPSLRSCLGAKAENVSIDLLANIQVTDPDGCRTLDDLGVKNSWTPEFKSYFLKLLNKYLKELQADKTYFAKIQKFIDNMKDRTIAINGFLTCLDLPREKSCYEEQVVQLALDKLAPLRLPDSHALDLAILYFEQHVHAEIKEHLTKHYRAFVSSQKMTIDNGASDLWKKCLSLNISDKLPPTGEYFTLSEGYLVSSIYNCVNADFLTSAKSIVRSMSVNNSKIGHPNEEKMITLEVISELQKSLHSIYQKNKIKEVSEIDNYILQEKDKIRSRLLENFNWTQNILNPNSLLKDCQSHVTSFIQYTPKYHVAAEVFGRLIVLSCSDIPLTPEYNQMIENSKNEFTQRLNSDLEKRILALANARAKGCIDKFPMNTNLDRIKFSKQREECLTSNWDEIVNLAFKEVAANPLVPKLKINLVDLRSQIEPDQRRLQIKVIKDNFRSP